MRTTVWAMLMCLVLTPSARAATFDCDKASTSVEKVICSDTRLTNLDDRLGRQYKEERAGGFVQRRGTQGGAKGLAVITQSMQGFRLHYEGLRRSYPCSECDVGACQVRRCHGDI